MSEKSSIMPSRYPLFFVDHEGGSPDGKPIQIDLTADATIVVDKGDVKFMIKDVRLGVVGEEKDSTPDMIILLSREIDTETTIRSLELAMQRVQKHGVLTMKQLLTRSRNNAEAESEASGQS